MKTIKVIIILFLTSALFGCMKEDYSNCPDNNSVLLLNFEYFDLEENDIFDEQIQQIDVVIFDGLFNFYTHLVVGEYELSQFKGIYHPIDPGIYYIVAWANVSEHSSMRDPADGEMLFNNAYLKHLGKSTTDPLHYAPDKRNREFNTSDEEYNLYEVKVASTGITQHTLNFMSAHRTINVYIEGLKEVEELAVHITQLAERYDYYLRPSLNETVDFEQFTHPITKVNTELSYATFYVPHFDNENPIDIIITGKKDTDFSDRISLSQFLLDNNISVFDGDDREIEILFKYEGGHLTEIKLPNWEVKPVNPGLN